MRYPRLASLSILIFPVSLVLSGCGGTPIVMSSNSADPTGTPPTVVAVGEQVNGVAPNRKQEVQFSEAMDPATINAQSFQVADSSGKLAQGSVSYDPDFNTASFLPSPALQTGATYTATITTAVASAGGMHLASPYSYTFATRSTTDTSPISVNSVIPAANATCVSATTAITITFDEAPDASTVNSTNIVVTGPGGAVIPVTMSINVTTTQVVLTPTSPLSSETITVTVSNVADLADVLMTSPYTWSFSTACGGGGGGGVNTFVYIGNITNIAGFEIAADGSASAVSGSPFALAANALVASPSGNFLFGDGQTGPGTGMAYYTYSVAANGSLSTASSTTQIPPNPVNGTQPLGLGWITTDRTGATLYGQEVSGSPSSGYQWMSEYAIGSSGSLSLLGAVDAQDDYSPISFSPNNGYAYFVAIPPFFNPGVVSYLTRNSDGTLTENGALNLAQPAGAPSGSSTPLYAMASPNSNYLAVLFGFSTGTVGIAVYPINSNGSAGAPTAFLPLTNNGEGAGNWTLVWDSSGSYVFASSAGIIYEARFDSSTNTAVLVGTTTSTTGPASADQMSFLNGHLFAVNRGAQNLYVYNFANGVLTPAPGSPVSLGFVPLSVAALQR